MPYSAWPYFRFLTPYLNLKTILLTIHKQQIRSLLRQKLKLIVRIDPQTKVWSFMGISSLNYTQVSKYIKYIYFILSIVQIY